MPIPTSIQAQVARPSHHWDWQPLAPPILVEMATAKQATQHHQQQQDITTRIAIIGAATDQQRLSAKVCHLRLPKSIPWLLSNAGCRMPTGQTTRCVDESADVAALSSSLTSRCPPRSLRRTLNARYASRKST